MKLALEVPQLVILVFWVLRAPRADFPDRYHLLLVPLRYFPLLLMPFFNIVDTVMVELILFRPLLHYLHQLKELVAALRLLDLFDYLVAVRNLAGLFRLDDRELPLQVGTHVQRVPIPGFTFLFLHVI